MGHHFGSSEFVTSVFVIFQDFCTFRGVLKSVSFISMILVFVVMTYVTWSPCTFECCKWLASHWYHWSYPTCVRPLIVILDVKCFSWYYNLQSDLSGCSCLVVDLGLAVQTSVWNQCYSIGGIPPAKYIASETTWWKVAVHHLHYVYNFLWHSFGAL